MSRAVNDEFKEAKKAFDPLYQYCWFFLSTQLRCI